MTETLGKFNLPDPALSEQILLLNQPGRLTQSGPAEQTSLVELLPPLRAFARSLCGGLDEADDLVRETLMKGAADLCAMEESRVKPWIFAVMRATYLAGLEDAASQQESPSSCLSEPFAADTQEWRPCAREIALAMDSLPGPEREAAVLVCMIGLSHEDTADICDCDTATIRDRVHDARTRLAALLGNPAAVTSDKPIADKSRVIRPRFQAIDSYGSKSSGSRSASGRGLRRARAGSSTRRGLSCVTGNHRRPAKFDRGTSSGSQHGRNRQGTTEGRSPSHTSVDFIGRQSPPAAPAAGPADTRINAASIGH
jgi:RNA polymerase sigma-70 factor (ECF subfamily)